eukprot:scaffold1401_cov180-Ochromonas_danica.AAC.12
MKNQIIKDEGILRGLRDSDQIVVGNWMDDHFCSTLGMYDTILADYLIGAVDGFSPYEQDVIIQRLQKHLLPNGRMYFVGMNPIPDEVNPPANVISEIRRARDACILLAGHRPYREFPLSWMTRHLGNAGLKVIETRNFTILHSEDSAVRQIRVARSKLDFMEHSLLRQGMDHYLMELESRTRATIKANGGKIPLSYDYVIAATHANQSETTEQQVSTAVAADSVPAPVPAPTDNSHSSPPAPIDASST